MYKIVAIVCLGLAATAAYSENTPWPVSGNVGIGTTSPLSPLTIYNDSAGVYGLTLATNFANGNTFAINPFVSGVSNGGLSVVDVTNSVARLVIQQTTGNVGIGTTNPAAKLHVFSLDNTIASILATNSGEPGELRVRSYSTQPSIMPSFGLVHSFYGDERNGFIKFWRGSSAIGGFLTFGTNGEERVRIDASGNVGIGTSDPRRHFEVWGGATNASMAITNGAGAAYLLMGNQDSAGVHKPSIISAANGGLCFGSGDDWLSNTGGTPSNALLISSSGGISVGSYAVNWNDAGVGNLIVSGNVGIGTAAPTHKLSVAGPIRAQEVIVDTGWSDYVFADDYRLAPLSEVERHIKAEKHLPGIPSASEVAKEGVSVGDMQARLLAKIEELTLHVIEQEKRLDTQKAELASLERRNAALERRLSELPQ